MVGLSLCMSKKTTHSHDPIETSQESRNINEMMSSIRIPLSSSIGRANLFSPTRPLHPNIHPPARSQTETCRNSTPQISFHRPGLYSIFIAEIPKLWRTTGTKNIHLLLECPGTGEDWRIEERVGAGILEDRVGGWLVWHGHHALLYDRARHEGVRVVEVFTAKNEKTRGREKSGSRMY